jgi:hypothetical protein
VFSFAYFFLTQRRLQRHHSRLVRDTRKSKDDKTLTDIVDWSFAKKAQAELKLK